MYHRQPWDYIVPKVEISYNKELSSRISLKECVQGDFKTNTIKYK